MRETRPTETEEPKARGRLVKDPEAVAIADIAAVMNDLDPPARTRVLKWVIDRYADAVAG